MDNVTQTILDGFGHLHRAIAHAFATSNQKDDQIMAALDDLTSITQKLATDFAAFLAAQMTTTAAVAAQKAADDATAAADEAAKDTAIGVQVSALTALDGQIMAATVTPPA